MIFRIIRSSFDDPGDVQYYLRDYDIVERRCTLLWDVYITGIKCFFVPNMNVPRPEAGRIRMNRFFVLHIGFIRVILGAWWTIRGRG